jgi:hypothetical protein
VTLPERAQRRDSEQHVAERTGVNDERLPHGEPGARRQPRSSASEAACSRPFVASAVPE